MKNTILAFSILLTMVACSKENEVMDKMETNISTGPVTPTNPNSTLIGTYETKGKILVISGNFTSGAHTTSGKAFVYEESDKSKTLVFENLMSDAGPDLRVYLSNDKAASSFVEVKNEVKNGNSFYKIPTSVDLSKQKTVLIWCKAFSVNFGSAELK